MFGIDITGWNKDRFKIYASLVSASYLKFQLDFLVDVSDSRGTRDDGQTLPEKATGIVTSWSRLRKLTQSWTPK